MSIRKQLDKLETGDGKNLHDYPTDERTHEEKLESLQEKHGSGAGFRLPRGELDSLVDLFV